MTDTLIRRLRHHVLARHAATLEPVPVRASFVGAMPPGWHLEVKAADVVVSARDGAPVPPATPRIDVTARDPVVASRLAAPSAEIQLDQPVIEHEFDALPMTLTVELVKPDGNPSGGRTVRARGRGNVSVPLPEVGGEPGVYRSAARVWTNTHHPLDVVVGTTPVRKTVLDFQSADTRVRLIDPT